jgi:aminomethyltransferase
VRTSPLDALHRRLGAKMVEFGGWEMPLSYSLGTVAEHLACRNDAVWFDVSHLGTVLVTGDDAFDSLQRAATNDLAKIAPGRAQYSHMCNDAGGIEDDVIIWWLDESEFHVMPNASNTRRILDVLDGRDVTGERAVVALQGPRARERLAAVSAPAAAVGRFRVERVDVLGIPCVVAGTGYTGEDGVEIALPVAAAESFVAAIADAGVVPAGLGARDTLRLEAALPLHGHDISPTITPLEAGLGWVVGWNKPYFVGRDALVRQRDAGLVRRLVGIATESRRPPRDGADVVVRNDGANDDRVGVVTSGNFSPVLGHGIALAMCREGSVAVGDDVRVVVRGQELAGRVVTTPFVSPPKNR